MPKPGYPQQLEPGVCAVLPTPFGALGIATTGEAIAGIHFLPPGTPEQPPRHALAEMAWEQLSRYLADPHWLFDLPLAPRGTDHQLRVWNEIRRIPCGEVRRYGELSSSIRSAARAVGQACGANPLPVVVPCHRVVRTGGGLGGFRWGLDVKRWLLAHEGAPV